MSDAYEDTLKRAKSAADSWLFAEEIEALIARIRQAERERCAQIVESWPIETHYVLAKQRLKERRAAIAAAIRGERDD